MTTESVSRPPSDRVLAFDFMKGIIVILMALDHAGLVFNRNHEDRDSWLDYASHLPIDGWEFLARFVTHICAPAFLFLGGISLAFSYERRRSRGGLNEAQFDRDLLIRGLLLLAIDLFWWGGMWLQVLYPFGIGYILLIVLRRFSPRILLALAAVMIIGSEIPLLIAQNAFGGDMEALRKSLFRDNSFSLWKWCFMLLTHTGRLAPTSIVAQYSLLPWLGILLLGWVYGLAYERMDRNSRSAQGRFFLIAGVLALLAAFILRWMNGYGNMLLPRYDNSLVQWLHFSKYPPSVTFIASQLGLMALGLAALFYHEKNRTAPPWDKNPLLVFGRTPLFFYILHMHLMKVLAVITGTRRKVGLEEQYLATILIVVIMYGLCFWYDRLKSSRRFPWLRYI